MFKCSNTVPAKGISKSTPEQHLMMLLAELYSLAIKKEQEEEEMTHLFQQVQVIYEDEYT